MSKNKFVFTATTVESADVEVEFADGHHVIPQWMVAHLGGTEAVTSPESLEGARAVTFAEFNRRFHSAASGAALNQVRRHIISEHLRNLPVTHVLR